MEEKELMLRDIYYSHAKHGSFLTQHQLYEKVHHYNITQKEVKHFLEQQQVYSKFKRMPGVTKFRKTIVFDLAQQIQVDLVILTKYKQENDGYGYILMAIELLSRTVFAQPLRFKKEQDVKQAFSLLLEDFLDRFDQYPEVIQWDEGKEFKNKVMNQFLREHDMKQFSTHSKRQATLVERANRTIQEKLRKLWVMEGDHEWVSHLSDVVESYNTSQHRSIQMKPNDVNEENKFVVWGRLYGQTATWKKPKFHVNDHVRIYHFKLLHRATRGFRKYYKQKYGPIPRTYITEEKPEHPFSNEVFRITNIKPLEHMNVYKLRNDEADETILGYFYEEELSLVA